MDKKVISIDEVKQIKFEEEFPEVFTLDDAVKYANQIEYYLNSFYELAKEDKKYHSVCTTEQLKILSSIYSSFFKIMFSELDEFEENYSTGSNRIMFKFLSELYKICKDLTDAEAVRENIDNPVLKLENKEEN